MLKGKVVGFIGAGNMRVYNQRLIQSGKLIHPILLRDITRSTFTGQDVWHSDHGL
jgi:hypothetical protein